MNIIDNQQLENLLNDNDSETTGTFVVGRFIIQPIYYAQDKNKCVYYDIESIQDEFNQVINEFQEFNDNTNFDWDNL